MKRTPFFTSLAEAFIESFSHVADQERALSELQACAAVLHDPHLQATLAEHEGESPAQLEETFSKLLPNFLPEVRHTLELLMERKMMDGLMEFIGCVSLLRAKRHVAKDVTVITAQPLDSGQRSKLLTVLSARWGMPVHMNEEIKPEVIGGIRVEGENELIDTTIKGRLDRLAQFVSRVI